LIKTPVRIAGAGLAGLSAAIGLARQGIGVQVFEKRQDSGATHRTRWDAIENWTTTTDFPMLVNAWGLNKSADFHPISELEIYDDYDNCYPLRLARPLFYLVRRGVALGSLEYGLKQQALDLGVHIRYGETLPRGQSDVWAVGSQKPGFFLSAGLIFCTSHPDSFKVMINMRRSPKAYAYLIIYQGMATLSVVITQQFTQARTFLDETLAAFQRIRPFDMEEVHLSGGLGGVMAMADQPQGDSISIGEAAGFQDYLWGFGIRHALYSGFLAARSIGEAIPYEQLIAREIRPLLQSSLVNRMFYDRAGDRVYRALIRRFSATQNLNRLLYHAYRTQITRRLFWQAARFHFAKALHP
jgi:flavin-dependent dehydrogenase